MLMEQFITERESRLDPDPRTGTKRAVGGGHPAGGPPIAMLGVAFDNVSLSGALGRIQAMIAARVPSYVVTANVDFLVQARRNAELRRVLLDAHLVLCDGTPLVWASRWLGNPLPERVAGADLAPQLIRVAAEHNYRLFFLGASPEANARAIANVRAQFPNANIAGHFSPPFRPLPQMDNAAISESILAARPDIVFVAFGCPKAEIWMARHYQSLGVPVMIGVGGTVDLLAGKLKRAPLWMRQAGVEWVFRWWQEPRRLFRRYLADLWSFIPAMAGQCWWMSRRGSGPARQGAPLASSLLPPTWLRLRAPGCLDAEAARRGGWIGDEVDGHNCLLDLAGVMRIDSTGVALLLHLRKKIQAQGRRLVLLGPSPAVRRALERMRTRDFFRTAADPAEASGLIGEPLNPNP